VTVDVGEFFEVVRGGRVKERLKEKPYPHGRACPACGKIVKEVADEDPRFCWSPRMRVYCEGCDWRTYRVRLVGKGW